MHPLTKISAAIAALCAAGGALAIDPGLSPQGYTGPGITPSAHLIDWGQMRLGYDSQLPGVRDPSGHNFVAGFGLLPNLEIAGRIATNNIHNNCYTQGCGARDLSASIKTGIGLDAANRFHIALGASDIGGQANFFRSYYGVVTYDPADYASVSLGVAKRATDTLPRSLPPLDGLFGSVVVQPWTWAQAHVEFSDKNAWAGAKLFAPQQWLPEGWKAYVGANVRLNDNTLTQRHWWTLGLTIPLYKVPNMGPASGAQPQSAPLSPTGARQEPTYAAVVPAQASVGAPVGTAPEGAAGAAAVALPDSAGQAAPAVAVPRSVSDEQLIILAEALRDKGLEDIQVGRLPDGVVGVRVNNATYNWNSLDGLGVILGVVARTLAPARVGYRVVMTQRRLPIVGVSGQADCLKQWVTGESATCTAGQLMTPGTTDLDRLLAGARWVTDGLAPSYRTLRIGLSPLLRSAWAHEYGLFDYSLGLRTAFQLPLWQGAYGEVRYVTPLAESRNYEAGGPFANQRVTSGVDRAVLSQAARVPLERWLSVEPSRAQALGLHALTAQVSVGRIIQRYNGVDGELRWEPGEGRHRWGVEAGRFERTGTPPIPYGNAVVEPQTAKLLLGSYRYNYVPTRTYFEATGGQFMYNDRGLQLGMRQWFADTALSLYYRRTKFDGQPKATSFVGIQISIPLGPRKDMNPGNLVQITGTPRWAFGIETTVAQSANYITPGYGVTPGLTSLDTTFNSDRSGLVYFEDNMRRIRDAARY